MKTAPEKSKAVTAIGTFLTDELTEVMGQISFSYYHFVLAGQKYHLSFTSHATARVV